MGIIISFVAGLLFASGLALSGMTHPEKVIGFLDFFGDWDPALVFVLAGATGTMALVYRFARGLARPFMAAQFYLPSKVTLDKKLVLGSALFGIGWGLAGLCPGPALVSLPNFSPGIGLFVLSMATGMLIHHLIMLPRKESA